MVVRPIALYPDPMLLRPTRPVSEVDERVRGLVADMVATMHAAPGIGLAANQVGESDRVCVIDLTAGEGTCAASVSALTPKERASPRARRALPC